MTELEEERPGNQAGRLMLNASSNDEIISFVEPIDIHAVILCLILFCHGNISPSLIMQFLWLRRSFELGWVETVIIFLRKTIWRYYYYYYAKDSGRPENDWPDFISRQFEPPTDALLARTISNVSISMYYALYVINIFVINRQINHSVETYFNYLETVLSHLKYVYTSNIFVG